MSDKVTIVNVTLEFTVQCKNQQDVEELDIISEAMMSGAVNATSKDAVGCGFNYDYTHKRSRRGLIIAKARKGFTGDKS